MRPAHAGFEADRIGQQKARRSPTRARRARTAPRGSASWYAARRRPCGCRHSRARGPSGRWRAALESPSLRLRPSTVACGLPPALLQHAEQLAIGAVCRCRRARSRSSRARRAAPRFRRPPRGRRTVRRRDAVHSVLVSVTASVLEVLGPCLSLIDVVYCGSMPASRMILAPARHVGPDQRVHVAGVPPSGS